MFYYECIDCSFRALFTIKLVGYVLLRPFIVSQLLLSVHWKPFIVARSVWYTSLFVSLRTCHLNLINGDIL